MLFEPLEKWDIKYGSTSDDPLPEENISSENSIQPNLLNYANVSSFQKVIRMVARIREIVASKSFKGGHIHNISTETFRQAEMFLLLEVQNEVDLSMNLKSR